MRSPKQLLEASKKASKKRPLVLQPSEFNNFIKAMKLEQAAADVRLGIKNINIMLLDKDALLRDGIKSPLDGKTIFTNRASYKEHLRANGCVEIGNDFNDAKSPSDVKGDFNCKEELGRATYEVMQRYGK